MDSVSKEAVTQIVADAINQWLNDDGFTVDECAESAAEELARFQEATRLAVAEECAGAIAALQVVRMSLAWQVMSGDLKALVEAALQPKVAGQ